MSEYHSVTLNAVTGRMQCKHRLKNMQTVAVKSSSLIGWTTTNLAFYIELFKMEGLLISFG